MIKIFGKYRYHWQPELSWLIIYWSLAVTPIFIAAALLFELYSVPSHILMLFTIFVALFGLGFHRYFIIEDHGILRIVSFNIFRPRKVKISDIEKDMTPVELAKGVMEELDITPVIEPIRGGTDGSKISFMGIPTPNLFAGGENMHGRYEFVSLQTMEKAVDVILGIVSKP